MFSGRPNFSLRNKKLTRRRSISGATAITTFGTSQAGIFANNKINKNKEENNKTVSLEISRPASVSSLAPQLMTSSLPPLNMNNRVNIKIDTSLYQSSPDGTPSLNDIRGKPEMKLFEVSATTTCGQLLQQVISRVIQLNPSNAKRDPNLFYIASIDINTESKELRHDVSPLVIIQKSAGLISHFKLQTRQGTVIKVYSNSIVPGCEYKTLAIDSKTSCREVMQLVLRAMRVDESIDKFVLQAFSPSIGMASRRIAIGQDDLALAALRGCGYEFSFLLIREHTPGSEPQRRSRFSRTRAKLSTEELRSPDSPDIDLDDFSVQPTTKSSNVGRILIDGPSTNNLLTTDSLISLTGLSFVSVDSNSDSSRNSYDDTPCHAPQDNMMLPICNVNKLDVTRSYSTPAYVKNELAIVNPVDIPSSPELYLTPDSNLSPSAEHKDFQSLSETIASNSPMPFLKFPPPPPFDPISITRGDSPNKTLEQAHFSKYNLLSPTEQDSGISSPHQNTPPQEDGSRISFLSETSLTSTSTTPSLAYAPGTLLYDLSVSSQQQRNTAHNISMFSIFKEFDVSTVEVVNNGQGLGMSLNETGTGLLGVQTIIPGSPVHNEGSIQQGDRIIEVNNRVVIGANSVTVAGIIRNCVGPVKFVIARSKLKPATSTEALVSDVVEEEIERLNRALKASKPVLSRLRLKNNCLNQQVTEMKKSIVQLNQEHKDSISKLETFEKDSTSLSMAVKGISQTGKFSLLAQLEIAQLETTRREISRFSEEVHTKLTTAKDKLKLAISQASNYKHENEKLVNDLNTLQNNFDKEKLNFAKHKNMLENIQSSACIDCKVKDNEIAALRANSNTPNTTRKPQNNRKSCENCHDNDAILEQLENELTDKMILIADQEAKLHTFRHRK
ncbi:hypothetical protein LOD99_3601 [Oopsacas minuta]|uniref:PDZ domain-containing protein n=1 Tax=Oopsacas minuta TaxID=111878 RepID=A0AAV7JX05_9METZ|nr:hypothetical protein LOD99_3601 [Oopsacas minuta]